MISVLYKVVYTVGFILLLLASCTTDEAPLSLIGGLILSGLLLLAVGAILHLLHGRLTTGREKTRLRRKPPKRAA